MSQRERDRHPPGEQAGPSERGLRSWLQRILERRTQFTRNVVKVSAGQVLRTGVSLLTVPVVTRLYAAEDFGLLQLLISLSATVGGVGALKYETAIVLPQDRRESGIVTALSLLVLLAVSALVAVVQLVAGERILAFFGAESLGPWALLVPLAILLGTAVKIAEYVLIADRHFGALSRNNVLQVSATQGLAIGAGLWRPSFLGLFLSRMIGSVLAVGVAFRLARPRLGAASLGELKRVARKYAKFPAVNAPGVFANTVAIELPVFLLARYFDAEVVGYYMLTSRLLQQPMLLVGQAVSKVYLQAAASAHLQSAANLFALYRSAVVRLSLLGLLPVVGVLLLAEPIVPLLLGGEYAPVARYMEIILLWKYAQFITSPVSTTFSVVNRQEIGVALMISSALARFGAMLYWAQSPEAMLWALSVTAAVFTLLYNGAAYALLARRARLEAATGD